MSGLDVDVAVVGGGIIGCLIARELVGRAPDLAVTVLDRDIAGSGASRRSAGVHFPRGATPRVRRMTEYSHRYYERLKESDPALPIFPLAASVVSGDAAAVTGAYLDLARLAERPDGAWDVAGCHYADVGALTTVLAGELRARVKFREGVAVTGVEPGPDGVELRLGTGESLLAGHVVIAPGPWVHAPAWRGLLEPLGVRVKQVVALHVDQVPAADDRLVVFQDVDAFLLPMAHRGHQLFSYTSLRWDVVPDEFTDGLSEQALTEGREVLGLLAPRLVERTTSGRVFCDAYSPTGEPLVRAVDRSGRVVFAGAANGSGYRLAPAVAAETVNLLRIGSGQRISA